MNRHYSLIFKTTWLLCFFYTTKLLAQEQAPFFVMFQEGLLPVEGTWNSMNEQFIEFTDISGENGQYYRSAIDSIIQIKEMACAKHLEIILANNPMLTIEDSLALTGQEHGLEMNWGEKYAGVITSITVEKLVLMELNGEEISFPLKQVKSIKVIGSKEAVLKNSLEKKKPTKVRKRIPKPAYVSIPTRINIVPTAFNLKSSTILFRSSGLYLNELIMGGKYLHATAGFRAIAPYLKLQATIPILKYLHVGGGVELNLKRARLGNFSDTNEYAFSSLITIGKPAYFINLAYKSKAPVFLPIQGVSDNTFFRNAKYYSFGGGFRLNETFQLLTESMVIIEEDLMEHNRIFFGFSALVRNGEMGIGLTTYNVEFDDELGKIVPNVERFFFNVMYTVRFL